MEAPAAASPPALALHDVSKRYGRRWALARLSYTLPAGRSLLLTGHNGSGKTTLLRIAAGVLRPDAGRVHVDGLTPKRDRSAYQRRIGYLSAVSAGLYPRLTVRRHLELWVALLFVPPSTAALHIESVTRRFALEDLLDRRTDRISMGQRQRLRLALTFLHRPDVLLLDEPGNSLDEPGREMLVAALDDVRRRQGAAIWCSPSGEDAPLEFDALLVLENGGIRVT